jgi:site-specific recombinase XerD
MAGVGVGELRLILKRIFLLKEIGKMIGTYVERLSWASAAKSNNIPMSVISESMGHENERTTQIYLASIDTLVIDDANAKILSFL